LPPPPSAVQIVEHDVVAARGGDDLPVAAAQGTIGPPAILDKPGLPDGLDVPGVDDQGCSVLARADGDTDWNRQTTWTSH
jgi:hypothetical protein